jgi:hypothetical protein
MKQAESMPHVTDAQLSAYLDGALTPAEERNVAAHLATCAVCQARLAGLRLTVAALGTLRDTPAMPDFRLPANVTSLARPRTTQVLARLAAAAMLIGALACFALGLGTAASNVSAHLSLAAASSVSNATTGQTAAGGKYPNASNPGMVTPTPPPVAFTNQTPTAPTHQPTGTVTTANQDTGSQGGAGVPPYEIDLALGGLLALGGAFTLWRSRR